MTVGKKGLLALPWGFSISVICFVLGGQPVAASPLVMPAAGASSVYQSELAAEEYMAMAKEGQGAMWGYTHLGIAFVESGNLNIRKAPSTDSLLAGKLPRFAACEVLSIENGWAYIRSGEVEGYVNKEYLLVGAAAKVYAQEIISPVVSVTTDGLKVRAQASLDAEVLTQVPLGEEMEFVSREGDWVKVSLDGEECYVFGEYVKVEEKLPVAITMTELRYGQGVSDIRVDLVEFAKQFVGNPYKWGGISLTKGADCSGFVYSVFKHFGMSLSRSSSAQAGDGKKIDLSQLQPGDLIFYGNGKGRINHVALYIGNSQVVHASSAKTGIKISNYKYRTPVKAVKIITE